MIGIFNTITINGTAIYQPNDLEIKREDVYAGEYVSLTGKTIADRIGWKYSDMTLKWDALTDAMLQALIGLEGAFYISFEDSDGVQHTEQVIRRGFSNTPTRITGPNGTKIWTGLEMEISFLNTHPIGE